MFLKGSVFIIAILSVQFLSFGQQGDWFNLDLTRDGVLGVSSHRAHEAYADKPSKTIIVAVIDSGVDPDHEDLKDHMWVNEGEIPDNGIDDDNNGYIDDIHGWNFLGGPDGQNVITDTYGHVRHYLALKKSLQSFDTIVLSSEHKRDYEKMLELKQTIDKKVAAAEKELESIKGFDETIMKVYAILRPFAGSKDVNEDFLKSIETEDERVLAAKSILLQLFYNGFDLNEYEEYKDYHYKRIHYHYNVSFDPRSIIGDNPDNPEESGYGNNDVLGGHADHGTHVAGIIGAVRDNGVGIDGVADNVRIMALRAVPDGDERDKDIANAIRYAVDNGAKVINMSFGKGYSPHKFAIDEVVRYAEEKDVLLVHAAGNAGVDIDEAVHYPVRTFLDSTVAPNWIEVGASDRTPNEYLLATFTNYGKRELEIFAPGVAMYSTIPGDGYEQNSGTSMAAPVISAIAAALWSYYPSLTADKVKKIIIDSGQPFDNLKVYYPGSGERGKSKKVKLKKIAAHPNVANLYSALLLADQMVQEDLMVRKN